MKKYGKIFALMALALSMGLSSTQAYASDNVTSISNVNSFKSDVVYADYNNLEDLANKLGVSKESLENAQIYLFDENTGEISASPKFIYQFANISGPREAWGSRPISTDWLGNGVSETFKISEGVAFQQSNNLNIGDKDVSVGLGFGKTLTYQLEKSFTVTNNSGKGDYVYFYAIYDSYTFDINNIFSGNREGFGSALKPRGIAVLPGWE